jgi:hypothetical protein
MGNALLQAQAGAQQPGGIAPPQAPDGIHPDIAQGHQTLLALFNQSSKAMQRLAHFESALDPLLKMGDTVTPEDVVTAAGRVVAKGEDPAMLASVLADMPEGPGALAGWLRQHTQQLAQARAQAEPVHEALRHRLGVSSLHALMSMSLNPQSTAPSLNPQAQGPNLLTMTPQGTA